MKFGPVLFHDKLGREVIFRSAEVSDAADLIEYLKTTAAETPFLSKEPEEITLTPEQEVRFIEQKIDAEGELMLVATINGRHAGNCTLMANAPFKRFAHRCGVAIALYQAYCGCGIGTAMMEIVLDVAKRTGYEQAELEVVSDNHRAIALYRKLGFEKYGVFPNNMKYADGTYADTDWMMKKL